MALELACKDLGMDCDFVARGETVQELMAAGGKHGAEAHNMTDAQLNDPKLGELIKSKVRTV